MNKNNKNKFLQILTETGRKIIKKTVLISIISIILYGIDNYHLKPKCKINQESSFCYFSPVISDLGGKIFQALLLLWLVDLGLKRETLNEIEEIFKRTQATKYLKGFYSKKEDYEEIIKISFQATTLGNEIKMLCLFETEIGMLCAEDFRKIKDKVISGCKLKILILHPESKLLECLETTGHITKDVYRNRAKVFLDKLSSLCNSLEDHHHRNIPIKGAIEVKLHKDLFSTIGYYSDSKDCSIVWMYFADTYAKGSEYPALHIANREIIDDVEKHFEYLWLKAVKEGIFLMRVTENSTETINNIKSVYSSI
ncbi:hypothetical protein GNE10_31880 [Nostoc sp. 2RC]|nr:hypothetical protein [Nostoc sp. 2RC]